ncbi:MAG: hemolysin family protein [Pseudomonadota bacterium]
MGDSIDESSRAAQGALPQGQTNSSLSSSLDIGLKETATKEAGNKTADASSDQASGQSAGLWRRLVNALQPGDDSIDTEHAAQLADPQVAPGLGYLGDLSVEDVSIPKAEIVSVPLNITKDDLVKTFRDSGLTRLPVYDGTIDSPAGFVHLKDFALKHGFNGGGGRFSLKKMLRPLMYVPPSMPIGVLLQKFQAERSHMALVIDEYGGVDGLATIEDLIEQVVGEIADEHDIDEGHYWNEEKPGCFIAQAKTPLTEFEQAIGFSLTEVDTVDEEEIDTLGGLIFMLLGRVPARGELVEHPSGAEIQVLDSDPRRIKRLRVRVPGHTDIAGE